ncbi:hypothetical protein HYC85_031969 [Camellia sinensis]|uniref:Uncharacterized protein n=1 Tax=Camellia sinensis TaxID=4442 RepID=A0A7J7FVR7_CAMSI|nr:hypothetical protein HYC85_031969 [Camellia sinensis]
MIRPVWPSVMVWVLIGFWASYLWWITAYQMDIFKKGYFLVDIVFNLFLVFSFYASNVMVIYLGAKIEKEPTNLFMATNASAKSLEVRSCYSETFWSTMSLRIPLLACCSSCSLPFTGTACYVSSNLTPILGFWVSFSVPL